MAVEQFGAGAFGLVIGWFAYMVNRHRKDDVKLADIGTLVGVIGGAAVLRLFGESPSLFAAYAIGLASGFLLYFLILLLFVILSGSFTIEWFLDGRRPKLPANFEYPDDKHGQRPLGG